VSGARILGELLRDDAALAAMVPPERLKAGRLPKGTPLDNILIRRIGRDKRQTLSREAVWHHTERMQVTVKAATYERQGQILDRIVSICADRIFASIADVTSVSVLSIGAGPDFEDDDATIFMGSEDFLVSFDRPA
jgi:hypothetical protein